MGRLLFTVLLPLSVLLGFSREEFIWVYTWISWDRFYYEQDTVDYIEIYGFEPNNEIIIPIPLLTEEYPRAAAQLDGFVRDSIKNNRSLEWALKYAKLSSGPTASVPDSLRRMMLYFIYHDNYARLKKPWFFDGCDIYFYFSDCAGTYSKGWVRYTFLNAAPSAHGFPELWHMGDCTVVWSETGDTIMDSLRAVKMFDEAAQGFRLVGSLSRPTWHPFLSVKPGTFHWEYKIPTIQIVVPVEFDCCEEFPEVFRKQDTLLLQAFVRGGFEYLVSYPNEYRESFKPFDSALTFR